MNTNYANMDELERNKVLWPLHCRRVDKRVDVVGRIEV